MTAKVSWPPQYQKLCRCFFFNFLRKLIFTNFYIILKNLLTYLTRFLLPSYLRYNYFLQLFFNYWLSFKGKVAWFRSTSFRRTPICFSSEKHFKCVLKIYRFFIPPGGQWYVILPPLVFPAKSDTNWYQVQGIPKGQESQYLWPPVWLFWISLFCKTKIVSCHTANSKPVKQEVNGMWYSPLKYSLPNQIPTDTKFREYWRGKYHCTIDLLFDWFGLVCFANKNKKIQLSQS